MKENYENQKLRTSYKPQFLRTWENLEEEEINVNDYRVVKERNCLQTELGEELAVTISRCLSSWILSLVTSPSFLCSEAQPQVQLLTNGMSGEVTVPTSRPDP